MEHEESGPTTGKPWNVRFTHEQERYLNEHFGDRHTYFAKLIDDALRLYFAVESPTRPWPRKYGTGRAA